MGPGQTFLLTCLGYSICTYYCMPAQVGECKTAQDCMIPMGITSENVAERFSVDRCVSNDAQISIACKYPIKQGDARRVRRCITRARCCCTGRREVLR